MSWANVVLFVGGFSAGAATVGGSWLYAELSATKQLLENTTTSIAQEGRAAQARTTFQMQAERAHEELQQIAGKCIISSDDPAYRMLQSQQEAYRAATAGSNERNASNRVP